MAGAHRDDKPVLCLDELLKLLLEFPHIAAHAEPAQLQRLTRGIQLLASRRMRKSIASGDRRAVMGIMGATTLGRVWLIAIAVLIVGLVEREAGLAAALLSAALFTLYFGSQVLDRLLTSEEQHMPVSGAGAPARTNSESEER